MNVTNKKRFRYFVGLTVALLGIFLSIWTSMKLDTFLSNEVLSSNLIVFLIIAICFIISVIVKKILRAPVKNEQKNIAYSHTVNIDEMSYTLDILRKNKILREYYDDNTTHLERDVYGKLWLHYKDDGLFNLLKGTPNRVDELWLLVDSSSDANYRAINLSHKQRCRPPYIALDIKGCFSVI